ncbi:MAG: hypothetical protein ACK5LP_02360, partial [Campylobacteraceae bacterium]
DIAATLYNDEIATNYHQNCWAYDTTYVIDLIDKPDGWSLSTKEPKDRINYTSKNSSYSLKQDKSVVTLEISSTNFNDGVAKNLDTWFNYKRETNVPHSAFKVKQKDFNITNSYDIKGTRGVDFDRTVSDEVIFLYGRTWAPSHIGSSPISANIKYEIYCGIYCNPVDFNILSSGKNRDDSLWYTNNLHSSTSFGNVTLYDEKTIKNKIGITPKSTTLINGGIEIITLTSELAPYTDFIRMHASDWLIYNKYISAANTNDFFVEFLSSGGGWAGEGFVDVAEKNSTGRVINISPSNRTKNKISW